MNLEGFLEPAIFKVGDQVRKVKGYSFDGEVRSVFTNKAGNVRLVVEMTGDNGKGMLHIFNQSQMALRDDG